MQWERNVEIESIIVNNADGKEYRHHYRIFSTNLNVTSSDTINHSQPDRYNWLDGEELRLKHEALESDEQKLRESDDISRPTIVTVKIKPGNGTSTRSTLLD